MAFSFHSSIKFFLYCRKSGGKIQDGRAIFQNNRAIISNDSSGGIGYNDYNHQSCRIYLEMVEEAAEKRK